MKRISMNDTISIRKFMTIYLGVDCDFISHLTHNKMMEYLEESGKKLPKRVNMDMINMSDVREGKYLLVREDQRKENGHFRSNNKVKIIAYVNPLYTKLNEQTRPDKEELRRLRNKILKESDLIEDEFGNLMDLYIYNMYSEEIPITNKYNRVNVLKMNRSMRKRG